MATTNKANTVLYIQNKQNSAEKRFGLNLMINMLSQTKNSAGNILLDATVNHIAEFLIITKGNKLPTVRQFIDSARVIGIYCCSQRVAKLLATSQGRFR